MAEKEKPKRDRQEESGISTSIYFDAGVLAELGYRAAVLERSRSWLVNRLCKDGLGILTAESDRQ